MVCKCFSIMDCRTNCLANHRQYECNIFEKDVVRDTVNDKSNVIYMVWFRVNFSSSKKHKKNHTRSLQTRTKLTVIFKKDVLYNIFSSCCVFADCKSGWKRYNGHCYYLFKTKMNWFDAQVNLAGFLLSIICFI